MVPAFFFLYIHQLYQVRVQLFDFLFSHAPSKTISTNRVLLWNVKGYFKKCVLGKNTRGIWRYIWNKRTEFSTIHGVSKNYILVIYYKQMKKKSIKSIALFFRSLYLIFKFQRAENKMYTHISFHFCWPSVPNQGSDVSKRMFKSAYHIGRR